MINRLLLEAPQKSHVEWLKNWAQADFTPVHDTLRDNMAAHWPDSSPLYYRIKQPWEMRSVIKN